MKAVDTNFLVRLLMKDDATQARKVYKICKEVEEQNEVLFVPLAVILELNWVLKSGYQVTRANILAALKELLNTPMFKFEGANALSRAIKGAEGSTFDFSDLIIAYTAKDNKCFTTLTFDKKAAKHSLFELM